MKRMNAVLLAASVALAGCVYTPVAHAGVSFDLYYSSLGRSGTWLVSANYGRVWQPAVYSPGWNPYYDGRWEYSDLGWTWVSDYAWGAIPYHYGTWALDPSLGWVWIPGYVWAPSWVVFREGAGTIGWAPVPPDFSIGASLGAASPPEAAFVFVPADDFTSRRIRRHVLPRAGRNAEYRRTREVGGPEIGRGVVVNRGLSVRRVERAVGGPVHPVPIARVSRAAPFDRVTRRQIAAPEHGPGRPIRAAEPRHEPPHAGRGERGGHGRGRGHAGHRHDNHGQH